MTKHKVYKFSKLAVVVIITACLLFGLYYVYLSIIRPVTYVDSRLYPVLGIDISAHNRRVNLYDAKEDSIKFVYIKATEGATFNDSLFMHNYLQAIDAGLSVGAYHFFRFDVNGDIQARHFLDVIDGMKFNLPVMIDVEQDGNPKIAETIVCQRLRDMLNILKSNGLTPILYVNRSGFKDYYLRGFKQYPLWFCSFRKPTPNIHWLFWQYSHKGEVAGIKGNVDMDVYCGNNAQFKAFSADTIHITYRTRDDG